MQREYLDRLSGSVQQFVLEVEKYAGVEIQVVRDPNQDAGGTTGKGKLAIEISAQSVRLFAPTNGYFPDGAVRHEVLHVRRFHVDGVPKLVLSDNERWDTQLSGALLGLDNAIEHIAIVPAELQFHPERRQHWEAVMQKVCSELPDVPENERNLAVCIHWTFLRHVLPDSPSVAIAGSFAKRHTLLKMANRFADQFISMLETKEELVRLLFLSFPEIPKHRAALEYINCVTGTIQKPIP